MQYLITYSVNGQEISKEIQADNMDAACEKAEDSMLWPLEFEKHYQQMKIDVHEEGGGYNTSFNAY